MGLGLSNIGIGTIILACGFWQRADPAALSTSSPMSLVTALFVAGAGAVSIGAYQLWRERHMYR